MRNLGAEIAKLLERSIRRCDLCNAANGGGACVDCRAAIEMIALLNLPNVKITLEE